MKGPLEIFGDLPQVEAGFTTREYTAEDAWADLKARGLLLARTKQVHKDTVAVVTEQMAAEWRAEGRDEVIFQGTDALVTNCLGVALSTMHADCLPIWLYDPSTGAVGMAHAGWRGTCAAIGPTMAETMVREFPGSLGFEAMKAVIGPGISFCCFEVGPEVYEAFQEKDFFLPAFARRGEGDRYFLDLKAMNRRQLQLLGIEAIETVSHCTVCTTNDSADAAGHRRYFSYRGEGGKNPGQMTGYIFKRP